MNAKILVPLGLALLAGLYWLVPRTHTSPPPVEEVAASAVHAPSADSRGAAPSVSPPAKGRREARAASRAASGPPATTVRGEEACTVGRVIDLGGAPVGDLGIVFRERAAPVEVLDVLGADGVARATPLVRAAADGVFRIPGERRGVLLVQDPVWTTVLAGIPVDARSGQESRIVVAPRIELAGIVVDELGATVAGARVSLEPPGDLRRHVGDVLDFAVALGWSTLTDELGRFRLAPAPALHEALLEVEHEGYQPLAEPAPEVVAAELVLVLHRPSTRDARLAGLVVDPAGSPVPEALVAFGLDTTRTDAGGRFALHLDDPDSLNRAVAGRATVPDDLLRAAKPGFLPGELRAPGRDTDGRPLWPDPLVVCLGGPPASIAGVVLDEEDRPLPGVRVWIDDPRLFGGLRREGEDRFPRLASVEGILAGAEPGWSWSETDAEGHFALEGLTEREYTLAVMDPGTLLRALEPHVRAGRHDVLLVLPSHALFPRLAGRVVDGRGDPVPHAQVFPMCDALVQRLEGQVMSTQHATTEGVVTDEKGRFVLERVPRDLVYLRIQGADVIPLEWGRGQEGGLERWIDRDPEELEIAVERRCHFQVELAVPAEADELGVLDSEGHELVVSEFLGNGRRDTERHSLSGGRSSTLAVGDRATTLVLYREGSEVRRVPIRLRAGELTSLNL